MAFEIVSRQFNKIKLEPVSPDSKYKMSPDILIDILKEKDKQRIIGNELEILALSSKVALNYVNNCEPISKSITLTGKPDGGKDKIANFTVNTLSYEGNFIHMNEFSQTAIIYEGETNWDGKILYLEDPPKESLDTSIVKVWMSGRCERWVTAPERQGTLKQSIDGQPVLIVTSYQGEVAIESDRRCDFLPVEDNKTIRNAIKKK